jgi:hypothetical protein
LQGPQLLRRAGSVSPLPAQLLFKGHPDAVKEVGPGGGGLVAGLTSMASRCVHASLDLVGTLGQELSGETWLTRMRPLEVMPAAEVAMGW